MNYFKMIFALVLTFSVNTTANANTTPAKATGWQNKVAETLERAAAKGFNGAIALQVANAPIEFYSAGELKQSVPLTAESLFSSGSVGKEFTTAAVLRLVQAGDLKLDDAIAEHLPSLPTWAEKVTVQQLLNHSSGLPRIQWHRGITTKDVMAQITSLEKLAFEPGRGYLYGNVNVVLRAQLVESITGQTFAEYLQTAFLDPLHMQNTVMFTEVLELATQVKGDYPTAINGVSIYTTPVDLLKWEIALLHGKAVTDRPLASLLNQHPLLTDEGRAEYDFGSFTRDNTSIVTIMHDGSNPSHHVLKYTNLAMNFSFVAMSSDGDKRTLYTLKDQVERLVR